MSTTVNTQEIHSKLKTMAFPDFEEVVRIVQETSKGAEPTPVKSVDMFIPSKFCQDTCASNEN